MDPCVRSVKYYVTTTKVPYSTLIEASTYGPMRKISEDR